MSKCIYHFTVLLDRASQKFQCGSKQSYSCIVLSSSATTEVLLQVDPDFNIKYGKIETIISVYNFILQLVHVFFFYKYCIINISIIIYIHIHKTKKKKKEIHCTHSKDTSTRKIHRSITKMKESRKEIDFKGFCIEHHHGLRK